MFTFALILFLLICILMVLTILMQSSKGGGLASSFGGMGGGSFLGARGTANFLQKATMVLGVAYGVITLLIGIYVSSANATSSGQSEAERMFEEQQQQMTLPQAPFDPATAQPVTGDEGTQLPLPEETPEQDEQNQ